MAKGIIISDPHQITDPPSQGAESNRSGKFLEGIVEREFLLRGVSAHPFSKHGNNGNLFAPHFLLKGVPYRSIYGAKSRSEFVYRHFTANISVRIECRWQQRAGSVDEKMAYLLMNARGAMPEPEIWLVIAGDGARPHAVEWIRNEAKRTSSKIIRVFDIAGVREAIKLLLKRPGQQPYPPTEGSGSLFDEVAV